MCQVGESSKLAGSGKIGRKGIGFKSVFQITDAPVVVSPPFQFRFDTAARGVFGFIVPSWIERPDEHVPPRHRDLLRRVCPTAAAGGGVAGGAGTLLVCPFAARVDGAELMRDLSFDGLSLAFLKNLQQITFVASSAAAPPPDGGDAASTKQHACGGGGLRERHRVERAPLSEALLSDAAGGDGGGFGDAILKGISVVSHRLSQISIERVEGTAGGGGGAVSRRHYRLHTYTIHKRLAGGGGATSAAAAPSAPTAASAGAAAPTTVLSLAFPVSDGLAPRRSADGEQVFAYLPVTSAGLPFALHADFELVASRQDVSDSHAANHVLLGRVPRLFVHAVLSDPALGEEVV
jgi:hypothetical protein